MNRRRFHFISILLFALIIMATLTRCHHGVELPCWEGYFDLKVRLDRQYQDVSVTWEGHKIEDTEPGEEWLDQDWCIRTDPPAPASDDDEVSMEPPPADDIIDFGCKRVHIGIWNSSVTVVGDDCPYTIVCEHQVFTQGGDGGQWIEFSNTGCTASSGLRHHHLQTDFSRYRSGIEPCNWTEQWELANSDWVVANGELRGNQTVTASRLLTWDIVPTDEPDIEILAKVLTHAKSSNAHAQLHLRSSGATAGTRRSYLTGLVNASGVDKLEIRKHIGNAFSTLGDYDFGYSTDAWYWIRFRVQGDNLRAKIWADGTSEPGGWQIVITDDEIFSGGWVGVGTYQASDDPYFSWFSVGFGGNSAGTPP